MKAKIHLEGSLLVMMQDGQRRMIVCTPYNGYVQHAEAGVAFGPVERTPEAEFRAKIQQVISRSRFDKR